MTNVIRKKGERDLDQSHVDSLVFRVAKNNSGDDCNHHRIAKSFLTNYFVLAVTLV